MLNQADIYRELGVKAAASQNVADTASVNFYRSQFSAMLALERAADKTKARAAFDGGWADARKI